MMKMNVEIILEDESGKVVGRKRVMVYRSLKEYMNSYTLVEDH